jgi:hypothetical protein
MEGGDWCARRIPAMMAPEARAGSSSANVMDRDGSTRPVVRALRVNPNIGFVTQIRIILSIQDIFSLFPIINDFPYNSGKIFYAHGV